MTSYYILLIHDRVCCLSVRELTNCLNLNFIWQCTCKCKLDSKFNWAINNTKALENYVDICTYCLDIIVRGHAYRNVCISAKFGLIVQWFQRRRLQCEKLTITDDTWWKRTTWSLATWAKSETEIFCRSDNDGHLYFNSTWFIHINELVYDIYL